MGPTAGPELTKELASISVDDEIAPDFMASLSVALCPEPRPQAISIVVNARDIPESLAEIIVAAVCTQIGQATDANTHGDVANRAFVDIAGIDALVDQVLATVDVELLDEARSLGVADAIDWAAPADESDVRRGAHVGAAHVAGGWLVPRPELVRQVIEVAEVRRLAVIAGPSGSGKSALAYSVAHEIRSSFRWQQVHSLTPTGRTGRDAVALLAARIEYLRPSTHAPVGILVDDAGRHDPVVLDRLLRRLVDFPNVITIVSIREEDRFPVRLLSTVATITPRLDETFAEHLWRDFRARHLTSWAGWREPAERADGFLLEYVTLLTEGENLDTILGAQVRAREADHTRHLELEILRIASCANQYGVPVPARAVQSALNANLSAFTAASRRLVDEHLIIEDSGNLLRPLHEIRSASLARASHPFGQRETLRDLVALVPATELARLLRRALESGADSAAMIRPAAERVMRDRDLQTLIAVASAFRTDGLRQRADDWKRILDECGVDAGRAVTTFMMSRTQQRPDTDGLLQPALLAAVMQLRDVPTDPDLQPLWQAIGAPLIEEILNKAVADHDPRHLLLQAVTVLRGIDSAALRGAADAIGARLSVWPLQDAADMTEAFRRAAPALAEQAVAAAGGEHHLLHRIATETPWLASLERTDDGIDGKWIFIDEELQPNQNEPVVEICRLALALAPTATIARVGAVDALGRLVMLSDFPLVDKAIPREKLPHTLEVSDNRAQARALSRLYGAGSLTSKLAAEADTIRALIDLLPEITIAHLSDRSVTRATLRRFEAAKALLLEMDAPAEAEYTDEIPGALGEYPVESVAVSVARSLLQHVIPNLARADITKRSPLHTIGMLDDLTPKISAMIELDRYRYLPDSPDCARLLEYVRHLRVIASASAGAGAPIRELMRAAASRHTGAARMAAAAGVAAERSSAALEQEADRMRLTLGRSGFAVSVAPSASDQPMTSWPPGDLAITVEGEEINTYLNRITLVSDAAREARAHPDRRIWIGLRKPEGYLRASIVQIAHRGVLLLGDHESPRAFAKVAPTPISTPYATFLRHARRLAAIAAITAIRGANVTLEDERRALEESSERLLNTWAQLDELTSPHDRTKYVSELNAILTTIGAAISDDFSTVKDFTDEGKSGWNKIESLQSLRLLNLDRTGEPSAAAAVILRTGVLISAVEDHFDIADAQFAHMLPRFA